MKRLFTGPITKKHRSERRYIVTLVSNKARFSVRRGQESGLVCLDQRLPYERTLKIEGKEADLEDPPPCLNV